MGVFVGGVYALVGLGLSLIFTGIRNTINICHGQLFILGSYLAFTFARNLGLDPLLSLVFVLPIVFCLGYALQFGLLNKVVFKGLDPYIMVTMGIGLVFENAILLVYKPDMRSLAPFASYAAASLEVAGVRISLAYLIDFIAALLIMLLVYFFMKRTYMGRAIRATSEDSVCAQLFGVNDRKIYATTYAIGSLLAAVGGVFAGLIYAFEPSSGWVYLDMAFAVIVLGGVGSIRGALLGGIILGVVQALASYYIGIVYAYLTSCLITLIILAIRPQGLLGYKV
jgi:branched-chain amino acid transport system permease protein